ncbi:hypothetical protein Sjap_022794 [Stephania japonica]|uniref:F-box protein GID2 n=1 Tax=Stephania japonica TaxID=461633 RepID=A0AAP0ESL5_9MAGN
MKRGVDDEDESNVIPDEKLLKRRKGEVEEEEEEEEEEVAWSGLGPDLLYEVMKHADARTLGVASCVNKQWNKTAQDERLWEMICTDHWVKSGSGIQQLRSVVLPLGGFRRLYSNLKTFFASPPPPPPPPTTTSTSSSSSSSSAMASVIPSRSKAPPRWGKDEFHLSLSLLSIRFYESMRPNNNVKKQ